MATTTDKGLVLMTEIARELGVTPDVIANSKELVPFWLGGRRYLFREDYNAWRDRVRRKATSPIRD